MIRRGRVLIGLLVALWTASAGAIELDEPRAKALYQQGADEFAQKHYQAAYDLFKKSFLLSHAPALLYNMASALEGAGRPHQAAEELRGYLRVNPESPQRSELQRRILALEEAQRILDQEPTHTPDGAVLDRPARSTRWKTHVAWAVPVGLVVLTGVAVGIYFGVRPAASVGCADATYGCVSVGK